MRVLQFCNDCNFVFARSVLQQHHINHFYIPTRVRFTCIMQSWRFVAFVCVVAFVEICLSQADWCENGMPTTTTVWPFTYLILIWYFVEWMHLLYSWRIFLWWKGMWKRLWYVLLSQILRHVRLSVKFWMVRAQDCLTTRYNLYLWSRNIWSCVW